MVCHEIIRTFPGIIVIKHGSAVRSGLSWYSKNNQIQPPFHANEWVWYIAEFSEFPLRQIELESHGNQSVIRMATHQTHSPMNFRLFGNIFDISKSPAQSQLLCCVKTCADSGIIRKNRSLDVELKGKMRLTLRWTDFCTTSWCSSHCRCAPVAGCWRCVASWDILRRRSASARRPTGRVPRDRNRRHPALPALPDRRGECVRILIQISFS